MNNNNHMEQEEFHPLAIQWHHADNVGGGGEGENEDEDENNEDDEESEINMTRSTSNFHKINHTLPQKDDSQWLKSLYDWFISEEPKSQTHTTLRNHIRLLLENEHHEHKHETIFTGVTSSTSSSSLDTLKWKQFQSKSLQIRNLLASFLHTHEMADISLYAPEQNIDILCHGCILSANSEYFKALLSETWTPMEEEEKHDEVHPINSFSTSTYTDTNTDPDIDIDTNHSVPNTNPAVITTRRINCDADSRHIQYLLKYFYGEDIFKSSSAALALSSTSATTAASASSTSALTSSSASSASLLASASAMRLTLESDHILSVQDAIGIYTLAHYWACSSSTLEAIVGYIYNKVQGESSVYVLTFADTYSLARLKDKCFTLAIHEMTTATTTTPTNKNGDDDAHDSTYVLEEEQEHLHLHTHILPSDVQECMTTLRRACVFVKSKHNFNVDCSVREMVAILKESLLEEEEVYRVSLSRHEEDMNTMKDEQKKCEQFKTSFDKGYLERLQKVQVSLSSQERAIRHRRAFYEQQEMSLNRLGL